MSAHRAHGYFFVRALGDGDRRWRPELTHHPVFVSECGGGGAIRHVQLEKDVAHMPRHGFLADAKRRRDAAIRLALRDVAEHLRLPRRQPARAGLGATTQGIDARDIRPRAELLEQVARRVELEV